MISSKLRNSGVLVMLGAIPGVIIRYLLGAYIPHFFNLPIGTLVANVLGSFILGMIVTMFRIGVTNSEFLTMIGIGFCGSLTTMSTFAFESVNLIDNQSFILFLTNISVTLLLVFVGAYIGRILAVYTYMSDE